MAEVLQLSKCKRAASFHHGCLDFSAERTVTLLIDAMHTAKMLEQILAS